MSEQNTIAAIRARWAGVAWRYEAGRDGDYVHSAMLYVGDDGDGAILLDEPNTQEQATLQLAAQAPADIRALIERIDKLLDEAWGDSLTIIAAAQRYREAVITLSGINAAEAALFAALDAVGGAP